MFSFGNEKKKDLKIYNIREGDPKSQAINCYKKLGPTFGHGHDLSISDKSNMRKQGDDYSEMCWTYKGLDYKHNNKLCGQSQEDHSGVMVFRTQEYEVFHLQ